MNGNPNPAAPVRVAAAERQALALALRKHGESYRGIAEQLRQQQGVSAKYSVSMAYDDVMAALRKLNAHNGELAEEVRRLELERLDDLHAVFWPRAVTGDYAALDRVLNIMDRRARYLDLYKEKGGAKIDVTLFIRQMAEEYGLDPDEAVREAARIVGRSARPCHDSEDASD